MDDEPDVGGLLHTRDVARWGPPGVIWEPTVLERARLIQTFAYLCVSVYTSAVLWRLDMTDRTSALRVGLAGVTGYAGFEAWRLLAGHPHFEVVRLAAGRGAGTTLADSWPALGPGATMPIEALTTGFAADLDVLVLALPHGLSAPYLAGLQAEGLLDGIRVLDLGGDFRLRDTGTYAKAYGARHPCPELLDHAVYGLTEVHRAAIADAPLVANPGCYPTATTLGARVLLAAGCGGPVHTSCVSGVSGAGRKASARTRYCEVQDSVVAYGVGGTHRHVPEMEQELCCPVIFTPHLVPTIRGMLATVTMASPSELTQERLHELAVSMYADEPLVVVRNTPPATRDVRGTGLTHVHVRLDPERETSQAFVAIDNLGKGAAAQGLQNLNVMFGLPETMGIPTIPLLP
ncbi:MAG TPA: N-acetyl-gamma-glutamyl-phosphate reductase [Deltaproteobacteria bacterium]|nr:N-acetyl-gamma-glutamyl-phosphate reductase [Deltaproteobacteria bacterium]